MDNNFKYDNPRDLLRFIQDVAETNAKISESEKWKNEWRFVMIQIAMRLTYLIYGGLQNLELMQKNIGKAEMRRKNNGDGGCFFYFNRFYFNIFIILQLKEKK